MSRPRSTIYREALQVSPERIAILSDNDLNVLMRHLLRAQAYKCGSPANEVVVNTEEKAKDKGCDGWTARPATEDDWLGSDDTCWQFKAGVAGQPAKLGSEVTKPMPKATLSNGGRFAVVASGSKNGETGESERRKVLVSAAEAAGIPVDKIVVIGSEALTTWCNQHPSVAAHWAGRPIGLWTLDEWLNQEEHQVPWQASAPIQSELDVRRHDLRFTDGGIHHLHIYGPPGVGKTRFALELCREAEWRSAVIYIRQSSDIRLGELIDSAATEDDVRLVVVADEVQAEDIRPLRDSVGRANGRIRLITVGHSATPDPSRIPALLVNPLGPQEMGNVVRGWHPGIPQEQVRFVVNFAAGYVRLARLTSNAVARDPALNMRGLLSRDEIRGFFDGMLGTRDRRALYVVAVLTSVGWTGEKQGEGEAIARHLKQDWNEVRAIVDDFHRREGIVPRGGCYRYISPTPLGIHLAVEAWTTYPDLLKSLPDVLPSEDAKNAYFERLKSIASNPQVREYARAELPSFFSLDDFVDARTVRRWSALSAAGPDEAARNALKALAGTSVEDRKRIQGRARRETVGALVRFAWNRSAFGDAALALALLAEAENEKWANNASGEFVARFQILLGGTSVPYLDRLPVLDDLLEKKRPLLVGLVVRALARAGDARATRIDIDSASDQVPEKEWRPTSMEEHLRCVEDALTRLCAIAERGLPDIQDELVTAAVKFSAMLRISPVKGKVASFFDAVREAYPDTRETLRRTIQEIIYAETEYRSELSADELEVLERMHARFEDHTLEGRLHQYVGENTWDRRVLLDLRPIAVELLSVSDALAEHWPWLSSGQASQAWRLGEAIAEIDPEGRLADSLPQLSGSGPDFRLISGYIDARRRTLGDAWYDGWLESQVARDPTPVALLFQVAWSCGATELWANMIAKILSTERVSSQIVNQLGFGRWDEAITADVLMTLLREMVNAGHGATALWILKRRIESHSSEIEFWKPLALELVKAPDAIRGQCMISYYWKEIANKLVMDYPVEIAAAIFREQADHKSEAWFIEHSDAAAVLLACVERDARGVWEALRPYLISATGALSFSIGFPGEVLAGMPPDDVLSWVAVMPEDRAVMVARLANNDMSTDATLVSRLLGEYGDNEAVADAFFNNYASGSWMGPTSAHWDRLATRLDAIASRTELPKLRRWASESARSLREAAERDYQREQEEELRLR